MQRGAIGRCVVRAREETRGREEVYTNGSL